MGNAARTKPRMDSFTKPYFFFSNNENNEVLYASPSVESVLGFRPADLIGKPCTAIVDYAHPLNSGIRNSGGPPSQEGLAPREGLLAVRDADGTSRILKVQSYREVDNADGARVNYAIAQDVTETYEKELELRERRARLNKAASSLSGKEPDVLFRVIDGKPNKTIARELGVTERAIERIRARLMKKFEAANAAELVKKATELRILNDILPISPVPNACLKNR